MVMLWRDWPRAKQLKAIHLQFVFSTEKQQIQLTLKAPERDREHDNKGQELEGRCVEVELLRDYMRLNAPKSEIKMFLDIHAHSAESSIFIFSPEH